MSSYNQRQFDLMREIIRLFKEGKIGVRDAAIQLEGLINAIDHPPTEIKEALLHEWGKFEDISSAMIVFGDSDLPDASAKILVDASKRICLLLDYASGKNQRGT